MKIQLSSTLPFTPIQLDSAHPLPQRAVGQLFGKEDDREYCMAVYQFSHSDNDTIHYQVNSTERVWLDGVQPDSVTLSESDFSDSLEWVEHQDSLTYKPYAFLVMNAMTKLVSNWDGVVYQTPSGEQLKDSFRDATLQVVDACVCNKLGLWVMVNLKESSNPATSHLLKSQQPGWVPL